MNTKKLRIQLPEDYDFGDIIMWNEQSNNIILKNTTKQITYSIKGYNKKEFMKLKEYIESNNPSIHFKILSLFNSAENVTQLGSHNEIDGVDNLFKYYCDECEKQTKFQLKSKYRGLHAECICCGEYASTIINYCCKCDKKCIFVKTLNEAINTCYNCDEKI